MIWENDTENCIISYMKRIASPGLMHDPGWSGLVNWGDPEGCYGRAVVGGFRMGITYTRGGFMLMYGKTNKIL